MKVVSLAAARAARSRQVTPEILPTVEVHPGRVEVEFACPDGTTVRVFFDSEQAEDFGELVIEAAKDSREVSRG